MSVFIHLDTVCLGNFVCNYPKWIVSKHSLLSGVLNNDPFAAR